MQGLFSPDSRFMQAMGRFGDLVILNLLFLISCIPIFTIGVASAAMYAVCFQLGTEKESGVFSSYVHAFRESFRQGTVIFLILALMLLAGGVDTLLLRSLGSWLRYGALVTMMLLVLAVLMYSYAFPLLSRFSNGTLATLKNALFLSLGYLPRSVVIGALNVFPLVLGLLDLYLFLQAGFLWVFLYFSASAYLNTRLLKKVFSRYL